MKYENQRPDLADQIKALVQSANSVKTVPHGIKTVNPGEGLQLVSGDGQEIFWDWETAAEYDSRIAEGREAIDQAQADLAQARLDLDAGAARVAENRQLLDALGPRVDDAQSQVTQTAKDLTSVDTRLTTTAGELSTLKGTVGDVSAAVATAEGKAARAESTAAAAQSTAQDAMAEYDGLRVKLDAALASSDGLYDDSSYELATRHAAGVPVIDVGEDAASGTKVAEFVKGTSDGNVFVYWEYRPVTPGHIYRVDMKARAVEGTPAMESWVGVRRADGTTSAFHATVKMGDLTTDWQRGYAEWTAPEDAAEARFFPIMPNANNTAGNRAWVDDHQVTDTTEQATLRLQVEDAKSEAEAASAKAVEAMTAANLAQTAADGKTTVTATVNAPSGVGLAVGDLHRQFSSLGSGGQILREWRWNGTTWVDHKISSDFLSHVDVGKLSGVFANISQHLQAGSIGTDYLTVGVGRNLVPNGGGQARYGWENFGYNDTGPATNNGYPGSFWIKGRANAISEQFSITPGDYAWRVSAKGQHDGGRAYVQFNYFDHTGTRTSFDYLVANQVIPNDTWSDFSGEVTVPAGTVKAQFYIYGNHSNGVVVDDYQWFTGFALEELVPGQLVVNGSITGDKVNAESVAAKVGQFVKVQAENVEVTEALSSRVVNAMTANVRNLVVTESAILQHTTLLGTTVASELNVTKLLRGRDAILTGTVDVDQLNVTSTMSAEIVRAMDTTTKRLVVTEDAILNRATVVESLVTPELISEKANIGDLAARLVTSGLLQTSTAANRGVKIDNSGIRAWDGSGRQTMNINGTSNYMTGEFSTAASGQRVKISNNSSIAAVDLYASRSTDDHVGIWYDSPDTNVLNSVGRILAISGSSYTRNSPGLEMWPMRGTFGFRGRWQQETDATKFVEISNSKGLDAGAWVQLEIPFQSPFPTNNSLLFPMVGVERVYGGDVVVMVRAITASSITLVAVNKANSGTSGAIKLRAVVFNLNA